MKANLLMLIGVALVVVLVVSPTESRCPSTRGVGSDCSFSTCTARQCASRGLECCPKPCGGRWCVRGKFPFVPVTQC